MNMKKKRTHETLEQGALQDSRPEQGHDKVPPLSFMFVCFLCEENGERMKTVFRTKNKYEINWIIYEYQLDLIQIRILLRVFRC